MSVFRKTIDGLKGLLSGMGLTLHYFVRFDKVITQQYPENRETLQLPSRYQGRVELVKDEAGGAYKCNTCGLCVKACPNNSISLEKTRDPETKKNKLVKYEYHFERCSLCGLCVDACKFDALRMNQSYETAVYDRSELTYEWRNERAAPAPPSEPPQTTPAASQPDAGQKPKA